VNSGQQLKVFGQVYTIYTAGINDNDWERSFISLCFFYGRNAGRDLHIDNCIIKQTDNMKREN